MDGTVTFGLVAVCFTVSTVVVSIFGWFISRFQTKSDADKAEDDIKNWIRKVEADVSSLRASMDRIGDNVSYIRGRLEPTKQSKED